MTSKNYIINNLAILAELKEKALAEGNREDAERIQTDIDELDNVFDDLKRLDELKRENQILKEEKFNQSLFLNGEIDKRQKAIEILKDSLHLGIDFYDYDYDYKFVVKVGGLFEHISSEEYELLKEVLGK